MGQALVGLAIASARPAGQRQWRFSLFCAVDSRWISIVKGFWSLAPGGPNQNITGRRTHFFRGFFCKMILNVLGTKIQPLLADTQNISSKLIGKVVEADELLATATWRPNAQIPPPLP